MAGLQCLVSNPTEFQGLYRTAETPAMPEKADLAVKSSGFPYSPSPRIGKGMYFDCAQLILNQSISYPRWQEQYINSTVVVELLYIATHINLASKVLFISGDP